MNKREVLGDISVVLKGGTLALLSSLLICCNLAEAAPSSGGGGGGYSQQQGEEANAEFENYPFKKAQGSLPADQVCGMRIKNGKIILLGYDHTFGEEQMKDGEDFSDPNFFKKYPKLMSVEMSAVQLTDEALENLQTYLPSNLKMLIIDSCAIGKKNYPVLADIIEKHNSLVSVRIRQYSATPEQAGTIVDSLMHLENLRCLGLGLGQVDEKTVGMIGNCIHKSKDTLKDLS